MKLLRHGDLLLYPTKKAELKLKKVFTGNEFVLAEGEQTGHQHKLTIPTKENAFTIYQDEKGQKYLDLNCKAQLTHQEHNNLIVLPNFYVVKHEREYDYFQETIKRVQD